MANIDYGKILGRSKTLLFREKWLWVYGLVLAAMGGGSGGSGSGGSSSSSTSNKDKVIENLPQDLPEKANEVLGAATSAIGEWFTNVPPGTWILIGMGILLMMVVGIAFSMFVRNWAAGALIAGLDEADMDKPVSLAETSSRGIKTVKPLILLGIKVALIVLGIVLLTMLVFGLGFAVFSQSKTGMIIWGITMGMIGLLVIFATIMLMGFASIFAQRLIVLHNMPHTDAFKKAFGLAKGNFMPTAIMGLINGAVGCTVGCLGTIASGLVLGIPAMAIVIPAFMGGFHVPSIPALMVLVILIVIFMQVNMLISAGLVVFNYSNWNIFVKEILKQEKNI